MRQLRSFAHAGVFHLNKVADLAAVRNACIRPEVHKRPRRNAVPKLCLVGDDIGKRASVSNARIVDLATALNDASFADNRPARKHNVRPKYGIPANLYIRAKRHGIRVEHRDAVFKVLVAKQLLCFRFACGKHGPVRHREIMCNARMQVFDQRRGNMAAFHALQEAVLKPCLITATHKPREPDIAGCAKKVT